MKVLGVGQGSIDVQICKKGFEVIYVWLNIGLLEEMMRFYQES